MCKIMTKYDLICAIFLHRVFNDSKLHIKAKTTTKSLLGLLDSTCSPLKSYLDGKSVLYWSQSTCRPYFMWKILTIEYWKRIFGSKRCKNRSECQWPLKNAENMSICVNRIKFDGILFCSFKNRLCHIQNGPNFLPFKNQSLGYCALMLIIRTNNEDDFFNSYILSTVKPLITSHLW